LESNTEVKEILSHINFSYPTPWYVCEHLSPERRAMMRASFRDAYPAICAAMEEQKIEREKKLGEMDEPESLP
jgi:hypothetical protein